jgi:hypothetical protein
MTIPAMGPITALTWALEVGGVERLSSIKKAVSYCGLCGAERSSRITGNHVALAVLDPQPGIENSSAMPSTLGPPGGSVRPRVNGLDQGHCRIGYSHLTAQNVAASCAAAVHRTVTTLIRLNNRPV